MSSLKLLCDLLSPPSSIDDVITWEDEEGELYNRLVFVTISHSLPVSSAYNQSRLTFFSWPIERSRSVFFNLFVIVEPLIYFCVCHGTPINKNLKNMNYVRKSNFSLLDTSTRKQLLQKLKSKKFNDSVVLAFLECTCYIQNLTKISVSQICVVTFSNFGNWIAFDLLQIRCLFYVWTTLLITVHTFAVAINIISLHIGK